MRSICICVSLPARCLSQLHVKTRTKRCLSVLHNCFQPVKQCSRLALMHSLKLLWITLHLSCITRLWLANPKDLCFAGHVKGSHQQPKFKQCKEGTRCSRDDRNIWCQSWCTAEEEGFCAGQTFLGQDPGSTQSIEGKVPCTGLLLSCACSLVMPVCFHVLVMCQS